MNTKETQRSNTFLPETFWRTMSPTKNTEQQPAPYLQCIVVHLFSFRVFLVWHQPRFDEIFIKAVPKPPNGDMVCSGKARKELQVHDTQWAVALQRANNHVLFNALVLAFLFPVSWGEFAALLFQKGRKVESAIRRKAVCHFTKH